MVALWCGLHENLKKFVFAPWCKELLARGKNWDKNGGLLQALAAMLVGLVSSDQGVSSSVPDIGRHWSMNTHYPPITPQPAAAASFSLQLHHHSCLNWPVQGTAQVGAR